MISKWLRAIVELTDIVQLQGIVADSETVKQCLHLRQTTDQYATNDEWQCRNPNNSDSDQWESYLLAVWTVRLSEEKHIALLLSCQTPALTLTLNLTVTQQWSMLRGFTDLLAVRTVRLREDEHFVVVNVFLNEWADVAWVSYRRHRHSLVTTGHWLVVTPK